MDDRSEKDKYPQCEFSTLNGNTNNFQNIPQTPSKLRTWISKNIMLLVTISGVVIGVIEGIFQLSSAIAAADSKTFVLQQIYKQ